MDDELAALAGRPGWTVEGRRATYAPSADGWSARVFRSANAARALERYHVAVVDERGVARHTGKASTVAEAARVAERHVGPPGS